MITALLFASVKLTCNVQRTGNSTHSVSRQFIRGTKRLVSVNICSVEGNSAGIFDSKVSPGIFVVKEK